MKNSLIKYFIWLFYTQAICLLFGIAFLVIIAIVASINELDLGTFLQKITYEKRNLFAVFESVALLILSLLIAVVKSTNFPELAKSKRSDYLKVCPWTLGKALPWGDYRLGFAELIILLVIEGLLLLLAHWPFGIALYLFAIYYFVTFHFYSLLVKGAINDLFITGILLSLPLLFISNFSLLVIPVFFTCHLISLHAQKQSWKYWVGLDGNIDKPEVLKTDKAHVGWPCCTVAEVIDDNEGINNRNGVILFCCCCCIWIFTLTSLIPIEEASRLMSFWYVPSLLFALVHRAAFSTIGNSPLTILSRIRTRNYIIANHDKIYLTPLFSIITGILVFLSQQA